MGNLAQLKGEHDQEDAQDDRPGGDEPEQCQDPSSWEDRGNQAENQRRRTRGDQQPFVVEHPAQLNCGHDPSDAGKDRPSGDQVQEGKRRPRGPDDYDNDAEEDADDTFCDPPALPDAQSRRDVDDPFHQGKGGQQKDEDADRYSGPDKSDDSEENGDRAAKGKGAPIASHGFNHVDHLQVDCRQAPPTLPSPRRGTGRARLRGRGI